MSIATSFWRLPSSGRLFMTKMKKSFHWMFIFTVLANRKIPSYVVAALGFLPVLAFALTPTITGVAGTVGPGQTLTITGTSMVQENTTNWDPLFSGSAYGFEGSSPAADGYTTSCSFLSYDSTVKLMGSKSMKMHDSGQHVRQADGSGVGACEWGWAVQAASGQGPADVYLRTYSRWNNTSWPDTDIKYWWMGNNTGNTIFFNFDPHGDGSAPTTWGFSADGVSAGSFQFFNIPGGAIQNNKWYLFEAHFRRAGFGSYVIEGWIDNQPVFTVPAIAGVGASGISGEWQSDVNYWNTPAGWSSDQWQDGFVVSGTRVGPASLIEIGNCATYLAGAKVYQEPLFLSDGSSQIKANLSGLGSGPYVLWVTNNGKERSLPFQLGTGTLSCAPAIPAPLNLKVL